MKNIIFLITYILFFSYCGFGQTVTDFESANSGDLISTKWGAAASVVNNPSPGGINTSAKCLKIDRTAGTNWYALVGINVNPDLEISSSDKKYLSMMVYYHAQPDLGCRFDGPNDSTNSSGEIIRPLNKYEEPYNTWQEIIIEIKDKDDPEITSFSKGTVFRIDFQPDMGFQNSPQGMILVAGGNNSAYIDDIKILDANPLSISDVELSNNLSIYPNPTNSFFTLKSKGNFSVSKVVIYNTLGVIVSNSPSVTENKYDISSLSAGIYLVEISDNRGAVTTKKLIKK